MKLGWASLVAALSLIAFFATAYLLRGRRGDVNDGTVAWEHVVTPGALTTSHAFLEDRCTACHAPYVGVETARCVVCHANAASVLERQPTAFHADISTCVPCHSEHEGRAALMSPMDHSALADIGLQRLALGTATDDEGRLHGERVQYWMGEAHRLGRDNPRLTLAEATLNCATCHQNDDPHFDLFGNSCSDCHGATSWSLPEFRHPSSASRDCSQCHQAPPSHYMGHFRMISQRVAGREHARVDQCFACHQTTSWTDIQRVGTYKHH